jgi:hypothetical protein
VLNHYSKEQIVSACWKKKNGSKRIACLFLDVDQLNQILYVLGTPDDHTIGRVGSDRVRRNKIK